MRKRVRDRIAKKQCEDNAHTQTVHFDIGGEDETNTTVIYDIDQGEEQSVEMQADDAQAVSQNSNSRGARPSSSGESWPSRQIDFSETATTEDLWIQKMQDKYQAWVEQDGDWDRLTKRKTERDSRTASGCCE